MKRSVAIGLALAAGTCVTNLQAQASRPWQSLNDASVEQVRRAWVNPPSEYGPEPYYGMNGPMTIEVAERDLDRMRELGLRAVTVQYGFGSDRAYLSPEYFSFF